MQLPVEKEPRNFQQVLLRNRNLVILCAALFIFFYTLYSVIGFSLAKTPAIKEYSILFGVDTPRAIDDIAVFSADHYRTKVHPIYVLLVNPFGIILKCVLKSKIAAALVLNCILGACGVCLGFLFFWLFGKNCMNALLLSGVFGLSMSQIFFGAMPETFSLSTCSLILTYIVFLVSLREGRLFFTYWIIAGILALGVTTTNFVQTLCCFVVTVIVLSKGGCGAGSVLLNVLRFVLFVFLVTCILSIVQKLIYASSTLFFLPEAYSEDVSYASVLIMREPILAIGRIAKYFFFVNFVAAKLHTFPVSYTQLPAVTFTSIYGNIGWVALGLWLLVLISGGLRNLFYEKRELPFFAGLSLCLLFNILLHSFYGIGGEHEATELFVYSGNYTFLVLAFVSHYARTKKISIRLLLTALALFMGVNNILIIRDIISVYT